MTKLFNAIIPLCVIAFFLFAFSMIPGHYIETKSKITLPGEIFTAGEIIYPDYGHDDTLVVVDPIGLNKAIAAADGTDYAISTALHRYCAVLNRPMPEFGLDMNSDSYLLLDYCYGDSIRVKYGTNFDSLMYNWND